MSCLQPLKSLANLEQSMDNVTTSVSGNGEQPTYRSLKNDNPRKAEKSLLQLKLL